MSGEIRKDTGSELDSLRRERNALERLGSALDISSNFYGSGPRIIGRGAESVVIGFEKAPRDVQKLNMRFLWDTVLHALNSPDESVTTPTELFQRLERRLHEREKECQHRTNELRNVFGDSLPQETIRVRRLLTTPQLFGSMVDAWAARKSEAVERDKAKEWFGTQEQWIPFLIREQKRAQPEQLVPMAFPVRGRYMEMRLPELDTALYNESMRRFIDGERPAGSIDRLFPYSFHPDSLLFLEKVQNDPVLKRVIKQFVERAIMYTKQTNRILDFIGSDNINVYKQGNQWRVILLDAQYPDEEYEPIFQVGKNAMGDIFFSRARLLHSDGFAVVREGKQNALLNVFAHVRCINTLAELVGSSQRISFTTREQKMPGEQWYDCMSSLHLWKEGRSLVPAWNTGKSVERRLPKRVAVTPPVIPNVLNYGEETLPTGRVSSEGESGDDTR